ncbi:MAG: hypothetical protein R3C61_02450 [Bacteroidia bacterium]
MNRCFLFFLMVIGPFSQLLSQSEPITITKALAIETSRYHFGRILHSDPVLKALSEGTFILPKAGDDMLINGDTKTWQAIETDENGWFSGSALRGGYICISYRSPQKQVVMLEEMGNLWGWINGEFRIGNQYQSKDNFEPWEPDFGFSMVPVELKKGNNLLVFRCSRGRFKLKIHASPGEAFLNARDATLPDLPTGTIPDYLGAIVVGNAQNSPAEGYKLEVSFPDAEVQTTEIGFLPPLGMRKTAFRIKGKYAISGNEPSDLVVKVKDREGRILAETSLSLRHRLPGELHKRTYQSAVDGSVQYFAVNPANGPKGPKALVLSVHGANVEGLNQAASYYPKSWVNIVSPTNRRPYGYNWEDWGRMDALAVLEEAKNCTKPIFSGYLTGPFDGRTWAPEPVATFPDHWAVIAPQCRVYESGQLLLAVLCPQQFLEENTLIRRSRNMAMTDSMAINYKQNGLYILHGGADDVVSARTGALRSFCFGKFHSKDFVYHEEPGGATDISDEEWNGLV